LGSTTDLDRIEFTGKPGEKDLATGHDTRHTKRPPEGGLSAALIWGYGYQASVAVLAFLIWQEGIARSS
jgi:hypothetical protein